VAGLAVPSDYLRKNSVLVQRGNFRPPTVLNNDLIEGAAAKMFCGNEKSVDEDGCILLQGARVLLELTIKDLRDSGDGLDWTEDYHAYLKRSSRDFLDRVDSISAMGYPCLVSNYFEYFELAEYLQRATKEQIVICMGVPAVKELFNASYYDHLPGGIMENFGRLVTQGLKIYVYPQLLKDGELITADNLRLAGRTQSLYDYLYQVRTQPRSPSAPPRGRRKLSTHGVCSSVHFFDVSHVRVRGERRRATSWPSTSTTWTS